MKKRLYIPILFMLAVLVLTACGSSKSSGLKADYFTCTPHILETTGGKIPVIIYGHFPGKFFNKNAIMTVTPVLKWNGQQTLGEVITFQGENVESNYKTINSKRGGGFSLRTVFDYQPAMDKSELYLEFKNKVGGKELPIPSIKIADGVMSTSELVKKTLKTTNPAVGQDSFQQKLTQKKEANIMFLVNQANLRNSELNSSAIKDFDQAIKDVKEGGQSKVIKNVEISAYASPEGGVFVNEQLAGAREMSASDFVKNQLGKNKVDTYVDSKYTAQDWDGFRELVSKSDIQDKDIILRVLSMYDDPEQREREIRNISSVYKDLADQILPRLRRARLTLNYQVIGRSDEEILGLIKTDPKKLNIEEMLYAATIANTNNEKEDIYKQVADLYPRDFRAYNNIGVLAYREGDYTKAENYFTKAAQQNPDAPEINTNFALLAMMKGDNEKAATYLSKGSGSNSFNEVIGNLYIAQGQYDKAITELKDLNTNSSALAYILSGNYMTAGNVLNSIKKRDASTSYLKAILAARTNDATNVAIYVKEAIDQDPSFAKKAASDLEFAKYAKDPSFKSVIGIY